MTAAMAVQIDAANLEETLTELQELVGSDPSDVLDRYPYLGNLMARIRAELDEDIDDVLGAAEDWGSRGAHHRLVL